MPAHVKDTRGAVKLEQRSAAVKCVTCPGVVKPHEYADGCRRCRACRTADPGRKIRAQIRNGTAGPGTRSDHPDWLTVKSKAVEAAPTSSWWMLPLTREEFQAAARTHTYSPVKGMGISRSAGDFRDV